MNTKCFALWTCVGWIVHFFLRIMGKKKNWQMNHKCNSNNDYPEPCGSILFLPKPNVFQWSSILALSSSPFDRRAWRGTGLARCPETRVKPIHDFNFLHLFFICRGMDGAYPGMHRTRWLNGRFGSRSHNITPADGQCAHGRSNNLHPEEGPHAHREVICSTKEKPAGLKLAVTVLPTMVGTNIFNPVKRRAFPLFEGNQFGCHASRHFSQHFQLIRSMPSREPI